MTAVCKRLNHWAGVILVCFAAAGPAHAKNINHAPDVTSDAYWDAHHISAVRVTATGRDAEGADYITYVVETPVSEGPQERARTVPASRLLLGAGTEGTVHIAVGDRFILYYSKDAPSVITADKLGEGPGGTRLLETLQRISQLRQNRTNHQAYIAGVVSGDPTVARYALRHLLEQSTPQVNGDDVARLLRLRDDESQETRVRVLANRLANRLPGAAEYPAAEYSWLQLSLAGSKEQQWTELNALVDRLLEFAERRSESVAFLTQLVMNPSAALSVRIAAYGAFEDARIFRFERPDAESERIFETCTMMLNDSEPAIRGAGAALLHNLSTRMNPVEKASHTERSSSAIGAALTRESNVGTRHQLENYLQLLMK